MSDAEELVQEASNESGESLKADQNLALLAASQEAAPVQQEIAAAERAPEKVEDPAGEQLAAAQAPDSVEEQELVPLREAEKSLALEEINKVDVVAPAPIAEAIVNHSFTVAQEDSVNADAPPAEGYAAQPEAQAPEMSLTTSPVQLREPSNDSSLKDEMTIETEPVPAPKKKAIRTQGSQNRPKKQRIVTVEYPVQEAPKALSAPRVAIQTSQVSHEPERVIAQAQVGVKPGAQLASAQIADFMREHALLCGLAAIIGAFSIYKTSRRNKQHDDQMPL